MTFKKSRIKKLLAMTEKEINENCKDFTEKDWYAISWKRNKMSANFLKKHASKLNWNWVCEYCKMDTKTLRKVADYLDWNQVSRYQKLDDDFINEYSDKLNWNWISKKRKINMDTIRANETNIDWHDICKKKKLSEDFILEHADKVDWNALSYKQKFSQKFIIQHKNEINWKCSKFYQHNILTHDTFMECVDKIVLYYLFDGTFDRRRNSKINRNDQIKIYKGYVAEYLTPRINNLTEKQISDWIYCCLPLGDKEIEILAPKFTNDHWDRIVGHNWNRREFSTNIKKKYKKQIEAAIKRVDNQDEIDRYNNYY